MTGTTVLPQSVRLSEVEMIQAAMCGLMRNIQAIRRRSESAAGLEPGRADWQIHVEGACGEAALGKALGVYWEPRVGTYHRQADVGSRWEVRTRSSHDWDLIVRPQDPDGSVFWLVTGAAPNFTVRGWILGRDAKREEWMRQHGGRPAAYFVPQTALNLDLPS